MSERRAVRKDELYAIVGLSTTQVDRLEGKDKFPNRFALGDAPNSPVFWWYDELIAWLETRPRRQGNQPKGLAKHQAMRR
jgi:predicted DNA-binding transcriptional regulator AlpA